MRSSSRNNRSIRLSWMMPVTPVVVSWASSFVVIASAPSAVDAQPPTAHTLIAQNNDNDMPPELRQHLRRAKTNNSDDSAGTGSGGPSFGERPFRRPRGNADGGDTNNSPPRPADDGQGPAFRNRPPFGELGNGAAPDGIARFRRRLGGDNAPGEGAMQQRFRRRGGAEGSGGGLFGRKPLDFSSLNLTDEQRQRIQQIRSGNGGRAREFSQSLKERRNEMRDLMFDPVSSDDQIRTKMREVRQMQEKMDDVQINDFLAIRKVLTPEQRQKLADLKPGRKVADQPPPADGGPPQQQR